MRRRQFITLFGGAAALAHPAGAQAPRKMPRVGILVGGSSTTHARHYEAFRQGLRTLGHVEGQTIALEVRWAEGRVDRMPELVAELMGLKLDILVMSNSAAAVAAKSATKSIPIVMQSGDPVGLGLVESLSRPGGNVTGLSLLSVEISGKRLEMFKEMVPGLARVALLREPSFPTNALFVRETEAAAGKLKIEAFTVEARVSGDLEAAFAAAARGKAQGMVVFESPFTITHRSQIVALAASSCILSFRWKRANTFILNTRTAQLTR